MDHLREWLLALTPPLNRTGWVVNMGTGERGHGVLSPTAPTLNPAAASAAEAAAQMDARYGTGAGAADGTDYGEATIDLAPLYQKMGWPFPVTFTDVIDARMVDGAPAAVMAATQPAAPPPIPPPAPSPLPTPIPAPVPAKKILDPAVASSAADELVADLAAAHNVIMSGQRLAWEKEPLWQLRILAHRVKDYLDALKGTL